MSEVDRIMINSQNHYPPGSHPEHHGQTASNYMDKPGTVPMRHHRRTFLHPDKTSLRTDFEECCPKADKQPLPFEQQPEQASFSGRDSGISSTSLSLTAKRIETLSPILDYLRKNQTIHRLRYQKRRALTYLFLHLKGILSTRKTNLHSFEHSRQLTRFALLYLWINAKILYRNLITTCMKIFKKNKK